MDGNNLKIGGGGFHHVAISVSDFENTLKFYMEGLGFKKYRSWGEGDKRVILLDAGDGCYLEVFAGGSKEKKAEGGFKHIALKTKNCDLALEQAIAAGAEVTVYPTDVDLETEPVTKVRIAFCKGPDGEVIEFFQSR